MIKRKTKRSGQSLRNTGRLRHQAMTLCPLRYVIVLLYLVEVIPVGPAFRLRVGTLSLAPISILREMISILYKA